MVMLLIWLMKLVLSQSRIPTMRLVWKRILMMIRMHSVTAVSTMTRKLLPFICVLRYYSHSTGRLSQEILSQVAIMDPLSLNLYTYFHNNHISGTDSTGYLMYAIYLQAIISIKIQPPKKGQFCPANSWAGLPFLFFLKQHTIRRNDRFCMLLFLLLCIRNKSTQNIYK